MKDKRVVANFFLLGSIVIFIISYLFNQQNILIFIIQKASEAAIVGGFADWFAVSALWRHPLGLKIPHTNIIEKNRYKLIESISKTVSDTWLSKKYLSEQIMKIDSSEIIISILQKKRYLKSIEKFVLGINMKLVNYLHSKAFEMILQKYIVNFIAKIDLLESFRLKIKYFLKSSAYNDLYNLFKQKLLFYVAEINEVKLANFVLDNISCDIKRILNPEIKEAFELNFDNLFENLCDLSVFLVNNNEEVLSVRINEFIENYKNQTISKDIVFTLLENFNILDKETLSKEFINQIKLFIEEAKANKTHQLRLNLKNYVLSQIDYYNDELYKKLIDLTEQILIKNISSIKHNIIGRIKEEQFFSFISDFLWNTIYSNEMKEFYIKNEPLIKKELSDAVISQIKLFIEQNQLYLTSKNNFNTNFKSLHAYTINQIMQNRSSINHYLTEKLTYIMRTNHHLIGKTVKNYLSELKQEQLISQIESKVGNDLQYIRINGSLVGSIVGIIIAVITIALKNLR